jgi:hypothetical protein
VFCGPARTLLFYSFTMSFYAFLRECHFSLWGVCFVRGYISFSGQIRRVSIELLACSLVNDGGPWLLELPRTQRLAIYNRPYQIQFSIPFSPFLISFFFHFSSLH